MAAGVTAQVGLSTSSVYPEGTAAAFEIASRLGYDGIEVMVGTDSVSQDPEALSALVKTNTAPSPPPRLTRRMTVTCLPPCAIRPPQLTKR